MTSSDLHTFTTKYFDSRTPSEWDFRSYLAGITKLNPAQTLGEVNSRFYTALKKIAASASSSSQTLARVQVLMYDVQQRSNKRKWNREQRRNRGQGNREQQPGFINHGKVSIAHAVGSNVIGDQRVGKGHITGSTAGGNPSIEGTKKVPRVEPRRTPTPTPTLTRSEFSEDGDGDEEDQYEAEEEGEEEEEEDPEQCNIPSGRPDRLDTSDTDRLDAFLSSFSAMREADKRIFTCSGRVLENLIHAVVIANPAAAAAEDTLDWVIDLGVENVRGWFPPRELKELRSWLPPTPKVDQFFTYARHRYDKKSSIIDLRETSESKPTPPDTPYDRKLTFNATYVNAAVTSLLSTIEQSATNESFGSPQSHREGWYGSKIWSMLLDHGLDDLDDFTVSRTDIASKVGCPGRRFDALFLAGGVGVDVAEVGAVEVSRSGDVLAVRKRRGDQGKLRELMKAMVKALWKMSKCDDEVGSKLQVVGVQHVGFNIRISTMCAVSRGVFVLQPGAWRAVPHKLENFEMVFDVLQAVVVMKGIVKRTMEVLRAHANVKGGEADGAFEL